MKYIILFICYFLTDPYLYGQSASGFYKKADSLYKAKDYKNSAIAYADGIRLEGSAASPGKYYSSACGWSLSGNTDSTFYYLSFLERSDKVSIGLFRNIEDDEDFDPVRQDKRWQPAMNAILKNAVSSITKFTESVRTGKRINPSLDKYDIALSWAVVKNTDSVLFYLNSMINTDYNRYIDYPKLSQEKTFSYLYNDPRWIALINEVKKNYLPFKCEHRENRRRIPMTLTIDPLSEFLKGDGKGSYHHNEDNVLAYYQTGCNLILSKKEPYQVSGNWTDASPRFVMIDLNKPVKNSGAVKRGVIKDHFAVIHVFYKIDTSLQLDLLYDFNEIPIGATIESSRTDIEFYDNKKFHMLQFGFWSWGDCGEPYAYGGKINGAGTTMIKITRHTATSYTIEALKGSIGRLWDLDNRTKPVDKGLYKSGFIIHAESQ